MIAITYAPAAPVSGGMLDASAKLIRQRAARLGLPNTSISVTGQHIVVAGPENDEAALRTLAASAVLRFRAVLLEAPSGSDTTSPASSASASSPASPSPSATSTDKTTSADDPVYGNASLVHPDVLKLFDYLVCKPGGQSSVWQAQIGYATAADWDNPDVQIVSCDTHGAKYVLDTATVLGEEVISATAEDDSRIGQWLVNLQFNHVGTAAFGTLTANLYNRYYAEAQAGNADDQVLDEVAIVLDGSVIFAPLIQFAIPGGQAQIIDSFTPAAAQELAVQLQGGYLPIRLQVLSVSAFTSTGSQ